MRWGCVCVCVVVVVVVTRANEGQLPPRCAPHPAVTVPAPSVCSNHERDFPGSGDYYKTSADSGGECGISTEVRYPSPDPTVNMQSDGWWAMNHGSALIIMLNSELEIGPGSDQFDFLNTTLQARKTAITVRRDGHVHSARRARRSHQLPTAFPPSLLAAALDDPLLPSPHLHGGGHPHGGQP